MTEWVFHIGYQKCASTWLQHKVFPQLPDVHFLGKCAPMAENDALPLVDHTVFGQIVGALRAHPFEYDAPGLAATLADCETSAPNTRVTLLSAEGLVGTPWRGGVDGPEKLRRIREQFDGAKILVVIRNQIDILESLYKQYLLGGGTCTVDVFFGPPTLHVDFRLGFLDYHKMATFCADLFGRERICVLPFELIRTEGHQAFCDRICDFFGVPRVKLRETDSDIVRTGYDPNLAYYARYANFFLKSFRNPCAPFRVSSFPGRAVWKISRAAAAMEKALGRRRSILKPETIESLRERFRAGNRELNDFCEVSVSELGYPV